MTGTQREDIKRLTLRQDALVRKLFVAAFRHVPLYREKYLLAGLSEADVRSVDDLGNLPIIDKLHLREFEPVNRTDSRLAIDDLIQIRTSGSTGHPLEFLIDRDYDQYRKAQYIRAQLLAGRRFSDVVFRMSDVDPEIRERAISNVTGWFRRLALLREHHLFPAEDPELQISELNRIRPDVVHAYPTTLELIAFIAGDQNLTLHRPRLILTDSELLTAGQRRSIEYAFGAPIRDIYGTFETDNIAYQCEQDGNYHVTSDSVILEIVRDGVPVPAGESGEIVCTVLHNHASPFIRYNLGDVAAFSTVPCPCGSTFPVLKTIAGRSDDYAVDSEGRKVSPQSFFGRFDELTGIQCYHVHQVRPDLFEVAVVPGRSFNERINDQIERNIKEVFPTAQVAVRIVDKLERGASGKLRTFTSAAND
jgi:phenylacetate-CoA ligase